MLTQLATVKARLNITDSTDDVLLTNFIKWVSDLFDLKCNRTLARTAAATHEFPADQRFLVPRCYPIETVDAVALKTTEALGFVLQSPMPDLVIKNSTTVALALQLGSEDQIGRITYTGGYVLPGTSPTGVQTALPDGIEQACVTQVVYNYQHRNKLGLASMSGDGGSQVFLNLELLPEVKATLQSYIRYNP